MKINQPPHRRALAVLVPATLLLAAPAFAQEAATPAPPVQTTTTPPPAPSAATPAAAPASGPAPLANGVAARNGIGDPNSPTLIAPEAIEQAEQSRTTRTRAAAPERAAAPRATQRMPAPRTAPIAAAPAPAPVAAAPAPAPVAAAPDAAPAATAPAEPAPAPATTDTATTTTNESAPIWPWVLGGLVVLGGLLAFFLRRRNRVEDYEEVYEEPVYQEPVAAAPVVAPVIVPVEPVVATQSQTQSHGRLAPQFLNSAPVAAARVADQADAVAVEAELAEPEAEDVAALTAGTAHADRPWLEFAMRPVRAGSTAEDALVEIELTVGNSGAIAAEDVRISTFMFTDVAQSSDMERLLAERSADSEVAPITIAPGEGTRIDATLSLPRDRFGEDARTANPVIVADARYRLADGSEGHTSAAFTIGMIGEPDEEQRGIAIYRPQMSDDVEARLHGMPDHA